MPALNGTTVTDTVLAALSRNRQRAVLSVGWGGLEAQQSTQTVHYIDQAPHDRLFPRCRAVVHHGGAGTTHAGLRHGRPTLVCPYFGDQPFWGRRVAAIGAGPASLPVRSLTDASLAKALRGLEAETFAAGARAAALCMAKENGPAAATTLIERALQA